MAECRFFPECQRCNETGDSWLPCAGGSDGTRCHGYEPMPDIGALLALADEICKMGNDYAKMGAIGFKFNLLSIASKIRKACGVVEE